MMAICPVGPPKEMKPSFSQNLNASAKLGAARRSGSTGVACKFIGVEGMRKAHQNIQSPDAKFLRQPVPVLPTL